MLSRDDDHGELVVAGVPRLPDRAVCPAPHDTAGAETHGSLRFMEGKERCQYCWSLHVGDFQAHPFMIDCALLSDDSPRAVGCSVDNLLGEGFCMNEVCRTSLPLTAPL